MIKEVGKIATSILGTIGREAARQISRNILVDVAANLAVFP